MASKLRITGKDGSYLDVERGEETVSLTINHPITGKLAGVDMEDDDAQALIHHLARFINPPGFYIEVDDDVEFE